VVTDDIYTTDRRQLYNYVMLYWQYEQDGVSDNSPELSHYQ